MQFRLLGPLEIWDGDERIDLDGAKQRALLALLLLNANRTVRRAQVIDWLWELEPPRTAQDLMHQHVSRLRRTLRGCRTAELSSQRLLTQPSGYMLQVQSEELDLDRFERLVDEAHQLMAAHELELASGILGQALRLWRGAALGNLPSSLPVDAERTRLEELRLTVLEERIEADLGVGRHAVLVGELEALVSAHPLRERLRAQLMLALYRSGRQPEALGVYQATRRLLAADYGLEPGSRLRELEQAILRDEPALYDLTGDTGLPSLQHRPPQPIPRELPSPIVEFTGRTPELELLAQLLGATSTTANCPVVISGIDGMGGIGKSALAIQAANRLTERFPDGQLYVNLHGATPGQTPRSPLDALGQLLRSLGLDPAAIPAQVEEAAVRWRSLAAGRRLLILLDNAQDAAQVRPLLPGSPSCAVVVTSRQVLGALDGAHSLHLGVLAADDALELLGRISGRQRVVAEPAAAAEVVGWCGRLPLAIRTAGARLAARPTWPIRELADRLADATRRLDELTVQGLAVRAAFDVSLQTLQGSLDEVDQAAAAAFGLLSLPDGPDVGVAAAARLLDQPESTTETLLERLVDTQLLQTPWPGRYRFHDLVRLHARQHAAGRQVHHEDQLDALTRLLGFYTATSWSTLALIRPGDRRLAGAAPRWTHGGRQFSDLGASLAWLEAERGNLLAAIWQAAALAPAVPAELSIQLAWALHGFFSVGSYWEDCIAANQTALRLALRTGDGVAQAFAHNDLGVAYEALGRYQEALASHHQSLTISRTREDRKGQAASLGNLGRVHQRLGHYREALTSLRDSLAINRALGDRRGQAVNLGNFGTLYERLGRYQEADNSLQESLTLFRELGERHAVASVLNDIGRVHERSGRYQDAIIVLEDSLAICRELGDRMDEAVSLHNLGRVYNGLEQYHTAIACYQDSIGLFRELSHPHDQAEALRDLGDALLGAGCAEEARKAWQEAVAICEDLRIPEKFEIDQRLAGSGRPIEYEPEERTPPPS
jgi:DNA-binding SARP family transcriptional activator/tetratricopeptide (TPR) repeat protein